MRNGASECEWRYAPEVRGGFWEIWKSQFGELSPASGEDGWLSLACRSQASGLCGRCHTCWGGGRRKSLNRKNVHLSPYVEEPLNSKVIKSFIPELRSQKCFSCFEIPMFYVYMSCIYVMNILCTFPISVSWVWYRLLKSHGTWVCQWYQPLLVYLEQSFTVWKKDWRN